MLNIPGEIHTEINSLEDGRSIENTDTYRNVCVEYDFSIIDFHRHVQRPLRATAFQAT